MRVTVIGAGAMGCLIGARLREAGDEVTLVSRNPVVRQAVAAQGVVLAEGGVRQSIALPIRAEPGGPSAELVLIMVKADDTPSAAKAARAAVGADTAVLTLQNGLGNVEAILAELPGCRLLAGSTTVGANSHGPGQVEAAGRGATALAPCSAKDLTLAEEIASHLDGAGLNCHAEPDPWPLIWNKVAVNAVINPMAALLGLTNGQLLELGGVEELAGSVLAEVQAVAKSQGVAVATDWHAVRGVLEVTRANRCSMLQDLLAGRPTEIRALNGRVAALGQAAQVAAPVNATLAGLVALAERRRGISAYP